MPSELMTYPNATTMCFRHSDKNEHENCSAEREETESKISESSLRSSLAVLLCVWLRGVLGDLASLPRKNTAALDTPGRWDSLSHE